MHSSFKLSLLSLLPLWGLCQGAVIDWGAPFNIGNDATNVPAAFDPARNGGRSASGVTAIVAAVNYGYSGVTVNGVAFTASAGDTDFWSGSGLDPQIDALLSGHTAFSEPYGVQTKTLTLSGLIPGRPYQLQIIGAHDNRTASSINRREYEIGRGSSFTGGTVPVLTRGAAAVGGYGTVIGTFIADAPTQAVAVRSNQQDGNLTDDVDPAISGYVLIGDFADEDGDGQPDGWPPVEEPIEYATVQQLGAAESAERIVEKAAKLLPRPNQVAWQRLETTFFVHFGPNTFNGVEWGTGTESPAVFNPTALDASQWVKEMADAGGKQLVLVVKHHDGFCLWPSRYTTHDVASSPWRGGSGDLLREVADACRARGIKLGVYLSPADLHQIKAAAPEGFYGNASAAVASTIPTDPASFRSAPATGRTPAEGYGTWSYTVDDYNRYFLNQLYELLTEYGPIHEVWFDGANPDSSTSQTYNHAAWYDLIRKLQPEAVIFGKGPDVRWVGNENGTARDTEWNVIPLTGPPETFTWPDMTDADLGSRARLTPGSYLWWYPAEADVPILNGWFWSSSKTPKAAGDLIDIYYRSVGRNANLLLNLSPDTRGLIADNQLTPLRSMAQVLKNTFATDLAAGATITTTDGTGEPARMLDGDPDTFWEAPEGAGTAEIVLELPAAKLLDVISLQEPIATRGQRIEGVAVDTWSGSAWQQRATATTVGNKRLIRLSTPVTTTRVRIRITASRLNPSLAGISLHKQAVATAAPVIQDRTAAGKVTLTQSASRPIRYTLDGSEPGVNSISYTGPISLPLGGLVRAIGVGTDGLPGLEASKAFPGIAPTGWVADADSSASGSAAANAVDGGASTAWISAASALPHWLRVDMGDSRWIGGFSYLPVAGGGAGTVTSYRFESSEDGVNWTLRSEGTFGNMANNPVRQDVTFEPVKARWFRFTGLAEVTGGATIRAAEISVIAAGFDAWKRDRGLQSLLPDDGFGAGTALAAYFLGDSGGLRSIGLPVDDRFLMELVARRDAADISLRFEVSDDLAEWSDATDVSQVSTESFAEDFERSVWELGLPANGLRAFTRAVFVLK